MSFLGSRENNESAHQLVRVVVDVVHWKRRDSGVGVVLFFRVFAGDVRIELLNSDFFLSDSSKTNKQAFHVQHKFSATTI